VTFNGSWFNNARLNNSIFFDGITAEVAQDLVDEDQRIRDALHRNAVRAERHRLAQTALAKAPQEMRPAPEPPAIPPDPARVAAIAKLLASARQSSVASPGAWVGGIVLPPS
jgi:hypothetical protein